MAAGQPSVFLSYASEDRQAVQAIRDALPGLGLDVWYDESALGGGEAWDQKIRRQIRECDFFMPIISARTEARTEGYFRREWRFAGERTLDMADDHVFLVPVAIDDTVGETARVPEKFLSVQWLRLPGGTPTPAFEALCRRLSSGQVADVPPSKRTANSAPKAPNAAKDRKSTPPASAPVQLPEFPRQEPGQNARFYGQAAVWMLQSAWIAFNRLPKWVRIVAYCWTFVLLIQRCDTSSDEKPKRASRVDAQASRADAQASRAEAQKIREISDRYLNSSDKDIAGLAAQIARQFPGEDAGPKSQSALLAIPFSAPPGDQHAKTVADAVFAQVYGSAAIKLNGQVRLEPGSAPPVDASAAAKRGRANHSLYVIYGAVGSDATPPQWLTVTVIESEDGDVVWSKTYPIESADAAGIAAEVPAKIPAPDKD